MMDNRNCVSALLPSILTLFMVSCLASCHLVFLHGMLSCFMIFIVLSCFGVSCLVSCNRVRVVIILLFHKLYGIFSCLVTCSTFSFMVNSLNGMLFCNMPFCYASCQHAFSFHKNRNDNQNDNGNNKNNSNNNKNNNNINNNNNNNNNNCPPLGIYELLHARTPACTHTHR